MTKTLLIRLDGTIQSWNSAPGNKERVTDPRPTKTAVVGMLANALGRDFEDDISDIAAVDFAVRADRAGHLERDYRTAGGSTYPALPADRLRGLPDGKNRLAWRPQTANHPAKNVNVDKPAPLTGVAPPAGKANPKQIADTLLVDACFTAAVTGDDALIDQLAHALKRPARALFLGKKAHPLSQPPFAGVTDHDNPRTALTDTTPEHPTADPGPWRIWYTAAANDLDGTIIYDQPQHFGQRPQRTARAEATGTVGGDPSAPLSDFF